MSVRHRSDGRQQRAVGRLSPKKAALLEQRLQEKGLVHSREAGRIPRRRGGGAAPLSFNQEGLWFIDQCHPEEPTYNIPGAVRIAGQLEVAVLEQSLGRIVERHEALRTTFRCSMDGTPYQMVAAATPFRLPIVDLRGWPKGESHDEAVRMATVEARTGFDLAAGPLFRASLVRLGDEDHILILNMHHIVSDGWSMGVFTRELTELYTRLVAGDQTPLPELPIQFADFAEWQRETLKGPVLEHRLAYWREALRGVSPLQLPTDRPRPRVNKYRGSHEPIQLSRSLTDQVRNLSSREGMTLFMTLLAAFQTLLHRYTRQNDIVVGTAIANRDRSELEGLIGYFATVLPLRTRLRGDPTFQELLRRVLDVVVGVPQHQLSLATLVKELGPDRDFGWNPLFQVEFTLLTPDENPAVYGYGVSKVPEILRLPGITLSPVEIEGGISRFDIAIILWDMPDGLTGTVEYNTDLFESGTIVGIVRSYQSLLRHLVANPEARLSSIVGHLDEEECHQQRLRREAHHLRVHQSLKNLWRRKSRPRKPPRADVDRAGGPTGQSAT